MRGATRVRQGGDAVVLRGVHRHPQVDLVEEEALSLLDLQGLADTIVDLDRETDWRTSVRLWGGRRCLVRFHPCDARPANHGDDGSHGDAPRALAQDRRSEYACWPHSALTSRAVGFRRCHRTGARPCKGRGSLTCATRLA